MSVAELTQGRGAVVGTTGVRLRWLEHSTHPSDLHCEESGWITHMVEACYNDTNVGHLRVSYVTPESSRAAAPDGLHFMSVNRGWCLRFDDPVELWIRAHLYAEKTPLSLRDDPDRPAPWGLSRSHAPSLDVLEQDLRVLHEIGERKRKELLSYSSDPTIDFARVDNGERSGTNWQRRGIATGMYLLAAQELGARGMVLAASSLQSPEAEALWVHFESNPEIPTSRVKVPWPHPLKETRLILDYRK